LWRPDCIRNISWNRFRYRTHQGEIHFDFRNDVSIAPLYSDPRFDAFSEVCRPSHGRSYVFDISSFVARRARKPCACSRGCTSRRCRSRPHRDDGAAHPLPISVCTDNFARDLQDRLGLLALSAPFRICQLQIPLASRETHPVSGYRLRINHSRDGPRASLYFPRDQRRWRRNSLNRAKRYASFAARRHGRPACLGEPSRPPVPIACNTKERGTDHNSNQCRVNQHCDRQRKSDHLDH
jgi:hypothetical protein